MSKRLFVHNLWEDDCEVLGTVAIGSTAYFVLCNIETNKISTRPCKECTRIDNPYKKKRIKNKVMTEIDPTKMRQDIVDYIMKIISSSEKNAKGLRSMADRGFSEKGMLEKVIEVTAIQSDQLKTLAQALLVYVKSDEFFSKLCMSLALQHEEEQKTV